VIFYRLAPPLFFKIITSCFHFNENMFVFYPALHSKSVLIQYIEHLEDTLSASNIGNIIRERTPYPAGKLEETVGGFSLSWPRALSILHYIAQFSTLKDITDFEQQPFNL